MASEEGFSEGVTSSSAASNNLAIPQRGFDCPICLDTIEDETYVSWCSHAFCFPCILEWACIRPVCPICQEPFQYLFRKVGDSNYEVYYTSSPRRNRGRRHHRHSAERRRNHSTGHRQRRSSSGERGSGHGRDWERDRSRSRRRNRDGYSRSQQAQSYHPSSRRRQQHRRAQDMASETPRGWDQASRHEWDVPGRSGRSEHRRRAQRAPSRESRATRSRSRPPRRTSRSPEGHRHRAGKELRVSGLQCQMASEKGLAEGSTSSSAASNNQVLQAESPHNSEKLMCPICLDIINNQVSVSWCSHAFCFPCILEWSRNRAVCPICREPFQYLLRKVGNSNYEVYSIGHYISSVRLNRGRSHHRHSAERRRNHSTGHRQRRSSSGERGSGHGRDWERDRSRSRRRNRDGYSRSQQAQSYHPSSSRRQQHRRAQDMASETPRGWDQASRHEWDVPGRSGRSEHRRRAQRAPSRESRATRSRSRPPRRTSRSPGGHRHR